MSWLQGLSQGIAQGTLLQCNVYQCAVAFLWYIKVYSYISRYLEQKAPLYSSRYIMYIEDISIVPRAYQSMSEGNVVFPTATIYPMHSEGTPLFQMYLQVFLRVSLFPQWYLKVSHVHRRYPNVSLSMYFIHAAFVVKGVSMYFAYIEGISMFPMHSSMFTRYPGLTLKACVQVGVSQGISQGIPQGLLPYSCRGIYLGVPCFLQGSRPQVSEFL